VSNACQPDPELSAVVEAWDRLPEAVRARIVGRVEGDRKCKAFRFEV